MHVFRWDLDRTYLDTEIHSWRGLVRAAFERAADKRTLPGAAALLRGLLAHDPGARVCVVSGSPLQMKDVLTQKLALDGVRVDRLILKDNLGNLRRGRLRAIRAQVGYKLPHLLEDRVETDPQATETLFGDDSETDALIYTAFAELLAGRIGEDVLVRLLTASFAYPDMIERAVAAARAIPRVDAVQDIFIRVDRGVPVGTYRQLGSRVLPVFSWFQAALVLHARGRLSAFGVLEVATTAGEAEAVAGWAADAVRRALVPEEVVRTVLDLPGFEAIRQVAAPVLDRLGPLAALEGSDRVPDLFGFYDATRQ